MPQRPSLLLSKVHALERHRALHSTPARHYTDIVTLTDVEIDDAQLGISGLAVTPSTLAPGQTGTAEFTGYIPTQAERDAGEVDRKSTRLNSSHVAISYAVFCLKKTQEHSSGGRRSCDATDV